MSGKDVGGDFCSGFPGELGKLVVEQARFNLQKKEKSKVVQPSHVPGRTGKDAHTHLIQEMHSQR